MANLDWTAPDYSTLCRRQNALGCPDPISPRRWAPQPVLGPRHRRDRSRGL